MKGLQLQMPDNTASKSDAYYPPSAFYFKIEFTSNKGQDTSFQEVSGLNVTIEYDRVAEGGENFFYYLPKPPKYDNLVLKRGMADISSPLVSWCAGILGPDFSKPVEPRTLNVFLLNEQGDACRAWNIVNALPVKWQIDGFNSTKNAVAIETIELTYNYFTREDSKYGH
jgi:phage tail-like protein